MSATSHQDTEFEGHRRHLFAVAYRILGSVGDAEDVVQEAWLRWSACDQAEVNDPRAWLTRITTRLAIDQWRWARRQRIDYVGSWLPEPVIEDDSPRPDSASELAEDISMALLLALERLGPEERAAFLLREVFDVGYGEIATTLGRSESACRQMVTRARSRVARERPRFDVSPGEHARVVQAFSQAVDDGDIETLTSLLTEDVQLWSDGGGKVAALRRPLFGSQAVIRALVGLARVQKGPLLVEQRRVNGRLGLLLRSADGLRTLMGFQVRDGRISGLYLIRNPDKLGDRATL